jgi:hypothetical protein
MPLGIIIKDRPVDWQKVRQIIEDKHNARRARWNAEGFQQAGLQAKRAAEIMGDDYRDGSFGLSVPIQVDGLLMDVCRERTGTTEWRKHKHFLRWLTKQPELNWMTDNFKRGIDRLLSEADDTKCTPCFEKSEHSHAQDLNKLPEYYRRGIDASKPITIRKRQP